MEHISKIGIDIDGVLRGKTTKSRTVDEYLAAAPLQNATEAVKSLVKLFGNKNIFIVSRCPEYAEDVIIQWLDNQKFFADLSFNRSNVYFCSERADKAPIAKRLKLTHFIDDRIDVLDAMKDIVENRIMFTGGSNHQKTEIDNNIIVLDSWNAVLEHLKR